MPALASAASIVGVALLVRLVVCLASVGTNDVVTWEEFGRLVGAVGVIPAYAENELLNHPPLASAFAAVCVRISDLLGVRFDIVFKLPVILADVLALALVARRSRLGACAMLLLLLNPASVLVSAFHGNTDSLCAALCLLGAFLREQGRSALAGLALAAAINVKLIPVVIVPVFLIASTPREAGRLLLGLTAGAIPFAVALAGDAASFLDNVLMYRSYWAMWGILLVMHTSRRAFPELQALLRGYLPFAPFVIVIANVLIATLARRGGRWDSYRLGAFAFSLFLVLAPGFGVQYIVYPIGFLFAARYRVGVEYAYLAGAFALLLYNAHWDGGFPVLASFTRYPGMLPYAIGFLAWYVLARFVAFETVRCVNSLRAADSE